MQWTMTNVIPSVTGLTVDGVIYQYTAVKKPTDAMTVTIQNKNALDTGYIFRKTDDWTGLPGNSITKVVPVDNIPGKYWGNGEIAVDGKGEVKNASVNYKYRYDSCANDVLSSPACPGYAEAMLKNLSLKSAEAVDPLSNEYLKSSIENKTTLEEESKKVGIVPETKKNEKVNNEKKVQPNNLLSTADIQKASQFEMMNNILGFEQYNINIPGGVYNDVIRYADTKLPDNRRARSLGLAQETLHKSMVDSQYNK